MDIFDKIRKDRGPLGQYQKVGHGYFLFPKLEGEIAPHMTFRGKEVLIWSLNNYIGLANHPEVRKADAEGAEKYGLAYPMGARMMSGQTALHEELENKLAEFVGKESAFLVNYGYQAMVSIIQTLAGRKDVIGKPIQYATTENFLHHFNIQKLTDLPTVDELSSAGLIDSATIDASIFGTGKFYKEQSQNKKEDIYSNIEKAIDETPKSD